MTRWVPGTEHGFGGGGEEGEEGRSSWCLCLLTFSAGMVSISRMNHKPPGILLNPGIVSFHLHSGPNKFCLPLPMSYWVIKPEKSCRISGRRV